MPDQTTVTDLPPMRYEPVSRRQLGVYARRLRRADRALTRAEALTQAEAHEASRAAAYAGNDTEETPMAWYCPECCASYGAAGTCPGCDITLDHGDPDAGAQ